MGLPSGIVHVCNVSLQVASCTIENIEAPVLLALHGVIGTLGDSQRIKTISLLDRRLFQHLSGAADDVTWNIRDRHMVDSAESLRDNLKKRGIKQPKIVICELPSPIRI